MSVGTKTDRCSMLFVNRVNTGIAEQLLMPVRTSMETPAALEGPHESRADVYRATSRPDCVRHAHSFGMHLFPIRKRQ